MNKRKQVLFTKKLALKIIKRIMFDDICRLLKL